MLAILKFKKSDFYAGFSSIYTEKKIFFLRRKDDCY